MAKPIERFDRSNIQSRRRPVVRQRITVRRWVENKWVREEAILLNPNGRF